MAAEPSVLLTGGRAPATLELARHLHAAGWRVVVVESARFPLTRWSRAVARSVRVPSPRFHTEAFVARLERIIDDERIDLLVPTCEEALHVAAHHQRLASRCRVLCSGFEETVALHDKARFVERMQALGLGVPRTQRLTTSEDLEAAWGRPGDLVLKPVYSRFAAEVVVRRGSQGRLPRIVVTEERPWIAQEFVPGQEWCAFAIAHAGRMSALATYPARLRIGRGACVAFDAERHAGVEDWTRRFVEATAYTGLVGIDFRLSATGEPLALECNPRLTSGIHLFDDPERVARAVTGNDEEMLRPRTGESAMLGAAMLLFALPAVRGWTALAAWSRTFGRARDVICRWGDPWPMLLQPLALAEVAAVAVRRGRGLTRASTYDIEWSGP